MATTNKTSDADHEKTLQPSPNEAKFTEVVKALLAEKHTHHDLKRRLHQLVMEEAQKLPPIKVLLCGSYGGFGFSEEFTTFVHSHTKLTDIGRDSLRSDPALIQAISDYGRFVCDKYPFILNDMRTVYAWKLDKLLGNLDQLPMKEMEFDADLVTEAKSFRKQMSDSKGRWRDDCLGSLPKSDQPGLETFTEKHPDFWMAHSYMSESHQSFGPPTFQIALRFAHVLLQGGDHAPRYHVEPDEVRDAAIYERIGLCGASTKYSRLGIEEIPALVDFSIHTYDGLESVEYGCGGGKEILSDIEYAD